MKIARSSCGDLVQAQEIQKVRDSFFCPICNQPLFLKTSHRGAKFFSHYGSCRVNKKLTSQLQNYRQESLTHQQFKKKFLDYFSDQKVVIKAEHYLQTTNQFADIYLEYFQKNWIIEYQQSPIDSKKLRLRHRLYQKESRQVYWVYQEDYYLSASLSSWAKSNLQYHPKIGLFFLSWDAKTESIIIRPHLSLINFKGSINQHKLQVPIIYLLDLSQIPIKNKDREPIKLAHNKIKYSQKQLDYKVVSYRSNPHYNNIISLLYQWGMTLYQVPGWVFFLPVEIIGINQPPWILFALFYGFLNMQLKEKSSNYKLIISDFYHVFIKIFDVAFTLPLIEFDWYPQLMEELVAFFVFHGDLRYEGFDRKLIFLSESSSN